MIGLNDILTMQNLPGPLQALMSRDADITFNFMVLVGGLPLGDFYAIETIEREIEPFVYKELGKNDTAHELIGQGSHGHVVLKWGMMNRSSLWDWMRDVAVPGEQQTGMAHALMGKALSKLGIGADVAPWRRDVLVLQMNRGKIPVRTYNFRDAFPVRWAGADLDANSSTNAIEELELSYRSIEVNAIPLPF